ncbi:MAG: tetratricopeptide repeat protein [Proteiniphilum sp.]|jgi:tetratricopeptide (TPR) repeat protein|nr:tetratricopeptide repeat protein [Proteiniphilum sp.]
MEKEDLYGWMENPDRLDASTLEELRTVVEEYPYFHTARLLYTKNLNLVDSQGYEEELGKTAVLCNDRRKLFYLIYREEYGKLLNKNEGVRLNKGDRTDELLESFLSSLGEREMIEPAVENMELNLATTNYLSYLKSLGESIGNLDQAEYQKLQHQDIIDAFIEKAESDIRFVPQETSPSGTRQEAEEKEEGGEFLTETLARIYIKQKKYEQALTIIKRLSLNFPKKSVYFAHQIRFLELLIINEKNKDK